MIRHKFIFKFDYHLSVIFFFKTNLGQKIRGISLLFLSEHSSFSRCVKNVKLYSHTSVYEGTDLRIAFLISCIHLYGSNLLLKKLCARRDEYLV